MPEWITTTKAAELTGYHAEHLRRLIRGGKVKARKFGIIWQVDRASLEAYCREAAGSEDKRRGAKRA
jgi:excisionase family DNA binding protein